MHVSDLLRLPRLAAAVSILASTACIPSVTLGPSETLRQDCRGAFDAELIATRDGGRKAKVVFELLPGDQNLSGIELSPDRAEIKGKTKTAAVHLSGTLIDACSDGGVSILASYPPTGTSGYFGIVAMVDPSEVEPVADPASGSFSYEVVMQCCGEASAASFDVDAADAQGVASVQVEPARFECAATEQHTLTVSGSVAAPGQVAKVELTVTHAEAGSMCSFIDAIEPGAAEAPPADADSTED